MKSTGVVRRIDELGRIVIPKEIRRSLRIRDGENLEIFVEKDMVALKKYSSMGDLEEIAKHVVESIYQYIQVPIMVTDRDTIIAAAGTIKKRYTGKGISHELETIMDNMEPVKQAEQRVLELAPDLTEKASYVLVPILVSGNTIGLVAILSSDRPIGDLEEKIAQITAQFLGKHIEE